MSQVKQIADTRILDNPMTTQSGSSQQTNQPNIMVVDDDSGLLQLLSIRLRREGFSVRTADSGREALSTLAQIHPDLVVTDLRMPDMDGIQLLSEISQRFPVMPVILLTAHGTIPDAIDATKQGAYAFLSKPINDDELISSINKALNLHTEQVVTEITNTSPDTQFSQYSQTLEKPSYMPTSTKWRESILTRSPVMEAVLQQAYLCSRSNASVIIESQSGTGKELLAKAIHDASDRENQPFIAVNCTAIPETLFESEMFGHAKGSFTGAYKNHIGLVEQANNGTLFLDEIGDMPMSFQAKLLRVLQEQKIRPLGLPETPVNVRIISATHQDLPASIEEKIFREDLYYRLSVVALRLPTLAERREDIPLLATAFLKQFKSGSKSQSGPTAFSHAAMELLVTASWQGNVRQLANVVQQCSVLCRSKLIPATLVEHALREKTRGLESLNNARLRFDFAYLSNLLQTTSGNVAQAARLADRNRSEFYKLLKKHDLDPSQFRAKE